ncbi:MAG: glycoside hydrolase [Gammaproteobacteria bacterium]|nr:glycoside hydrolase [Gammaproteobacteria bacterium]
MPLADADRRLVDACRTRAIELLHRNDTPAGLLAATPGAAARARHYDSVFARDAAICALGMAASGVRSLQRRAARGLLSLAARQAPNGQLPNYVSAGRAEADFWYLGCVDASLWWLLAVDYLDVSAHPGLRERLQVRIARAVNWLRAQEHPHLHLIVQPEAADWADIMPRAGVVAYTNALWYRVKRRYRVAGGAHTRTRFAALLDPGGAPEPDDRRMRLLREAVPIDARGGDLYLSYLNLASCGIEGDVLGNVLAVLCGVSDAARSRRILAALCAAGVHRPYPVRVVVAPITRADERWRPYMLRHRQNLPWQYHNGGIWPFAGAFWILAVARLHGRAAAAAELVKLAQANRLGRWRFSEWLHGTSGRTRGMAAQSWNAAGFLLAHAAVMNDEFRSPF